MTIIYDLGNIEMNSIGNGFSQLRLPRPVPCPRLRRVKINDILAINPICSQTFLCIL